MPHWFLLALLSSFLIAAGETSAASFDLTYWKKILHYHHSKSRADGEKFFLSPQGKNNPVEELSATIAAFKNPEAHAGWFRYHPQCVFRERFRFLKEQGLIEGIEEQVCPEFLEWKAGLNADSVTLIFSSSYPNNPSSLFGHTLLRLNQKNKTNDLLDYAVAFSAIPEKDDPGIVFAAKGLFGGYKGLFEITKYYTKVNEYNDGESRDLVEYNLNMTPLELERLINHLWELYQTTYFDYFFTDENCSAVLADLLAVAFKDDPRVNDHARWYYLPAEMVKHFFETPGRVRSVKYRPSLKKQLLKSWEKLSSSELHMLKDILRKNKLPEDLKNLQVLDNIIGYLNFTSYRTKVKLEEEEENLLRKSLIQRANFTEQESGIKAEVYEQSNRPELAHKPQKFSVFLRSQNHKLLTGVEIKEGFHDLLARDVGYDPFSQFDFGMAALLFDLKNRKLYYDHVTLVNLTSLHEYLYFDPQLSWRIKLLSDQLYELDCSLCHKTSFEGLGGVSVKPFRKAILSFMAGIFFDVSPHLKKGIRAGPVGEISFYSQWGDHYKIGLTEEIHFDATKNLRKDFYNKLALRQSVFLNEKNDFRAESFIVSKLGQLKKNTIVHQVSYGYYF